MNLTECLAASGNIVIPLHATADIVIFVACCGLTIATLLYARNKPDFKRAGYIVAGLIFWVGLLYLGSFLSLFYPIYTTVGMMKAITAAFLLIAAISSFPLLPRALDILSPQEYEKVIRDLYNSNKYMEAEVSKATVESQALAKELTRRVRHVLATVHGISKETARSASDIKTYLQKFNSRVVSLTHSNDLLLSNSWRGAELKDVIRVQLEQFSNLAKSTLLTGPPIYLRPSAVQQISLALHELAANANGNTVTISWEEHKDETNKENSTFNMHWEEMIPEGATEQSDHKGFGDVILNYAVPTSLNGLSELRFTDQNVRWDLECPLTSMCNG